VKLGQPSRGRGVGVGSQLVTGQVLALNNSGSNPGNRSGGQGIGSS